jgi:hypothetical protein
MYCGPYTLNLIRMFAYKIFKKINFFNLFSLRIIKTYLHMNREKIYLENFVLFWPKRRSNNPDFSTLVFNRGQYCK